MKFKMYWLESHDPNNHCDEKDHNFSDAEAKKILDEAQLNGKDSWDGQNWVDDYDEQYKLGVLNILASVPNGKLENIDSHDQWIEVLACKIFRAKNIENAKKIAKRIAEELCPECEVFSVFVVENEKEERVFTEEDIYQGV